MTTPGRVAPGIGTTNGIEPVAIEELVVFGDRAIRRDHALRLAVDLDDLLAAVERDAVRLVPGIVMDQDVFDRPSRPTAPGESMMRL